MNAPRVAVVVPSWNSEDDLPACIESVRGQSGVAVEQHVVDNGSTDRSVEVLERLGAPHDRWDRNRGFAAAVNRGIQTTSAPFVLVLNADARLAEGCLSTLVSRLAADPGLGGVQPKILQAGGAGPQRIYSVGQAITAGGRAHEIGAGQPDGDEYGVGSLVFGVCGAVCLLRREMLEQLGGYDERYFAFYEDVDLNARGRLLGWAFACEPDAVAEHIGAASWSRQPSKAAARFNARLVARNRLATSLKVLPARSAPYVVAVEVGSLVRAVPRRTFRATALGMAEALGLLPDLLRERRDLSSGGRSRLLRPWLSSRPSR